MNTDPRLTWTPAYKLIKVYPGMEDKLGLLINKDGYTKNGVISIIYYNPETYPQYWEKIKITIMKPSDFKLNGILSDFIKLDTLVIFIDNSYTTDTKGQKAFPSFDEGIFRVIDNNKAFPTNRIGSVPSICNPINNIKVRDIYTGKIYHCSNLNLKSIEHGNALGYDEPCVVYHGQLLTVKNVFFTYPPHW